jgi:hypothetical protein
MGVAAASPMDELEALEQARSRLEAALAEDENWRALRRPVPDDPRPSAAMARLARNNRLEMALAGNELYRAWKHVNVAIEALRARQPDETPQSSNQGSAPAAHSRPRAAAALRTARRLMQRLEAVRAEPTRTGVSPEPETEPETGPVVARPQAEPPVPGRRPARKARADVSEPAEATVTFVVREQAITRAADGRPEGHVGAAEPAPAAPAVANPASPAPLAPFIEEAEVTIVAGAAGSSGPREDGTERKSR